MKIFLSLLVLSFSLQCWAQTQAIQPTKLPTASPSNKKLEVMPFADHADNGCPSNSYCSIFAGSERKKWIAFMNTLSGTPQTRVAKLEEFRKKTGLPFTAWVTPEKQKEKEVISWDSRCLHHQKEGNTYYHAEVMAPSIYALKEKRLVVDQTYTIIKGNIVRTYTIPREEYPLYVDGDDLVFLREEEGTYYALKITPSGLAEVIEQANLGSDDYPAEVACPESLVNFSKDREKGRNLYLGNPFCKQVKNIRTKESQIFLFNKTCN